MPIHELSRPIKKKGIWRVDGLGEISQTNQGLDIEVLLSQTHSPDIGYQKASITGETHSHKANIREVFKLITGSYWEEQNRLTDPPVISPKYTIDTTGVIPTHSPTFQGIDVLKALYNIYFHIGDNFNQIKKNPYYVLPVIGNNLTNFLLIPAYEVYRCYVGVSDRLLRQALLSECNDLVDWEKSTFKKYGTPTLVLKREMSYWERYVCARALCSKEAYRSLKGPHRYLQTARTNNSLNTKNVQAEVLVGFFPFQGTTNLEVSGKRFKIRKGDEDLWGVYVTEINHCSYKEDLSEVVIIKDFQGSNRSAGDTGRNSPPSIPFNDYKEPDPDELPPGNSFLPANKRRKRLTSTTHQNRFNTETFKPEVKSNQLSTGPSKMPSGLKGPSTRTGEDGDYSKDAKGNNGIDEHETPITPEIRDLESFVKATQKFSAIGCKVSGVFFGSRKHDINQISVTSFPTPIYSSTNWHIIDNHNRRLSLIKLELPHDSEKQFIYMAEMETRPKDNAQVTTVLHKKNFQEIHENDLLNYLHLTIDKKLWAHQRHTYTYKELDKISKSLFSDIYNIRIKHLTKSQIKKYTEKGINIPNKWGEKLISSLKENIVEFRVSLEKYQ